MASSTTSDPDILQSCAVLQVLRQSLGSLRSHPITCLDYVTSWKYIRWKVTATGSTNSVAAPEKGELERLHPVRGMQAPPVTHTNNETHRAHAHTRLIQKCVCFSPPIPSCCSPVQYSRPATNACTPLTLSMFPCYA